MTTMQNNQKIKLVLLWVFIPIIVWTSSVAIDRHLNDPKVEEYPRKVTVEFLQNLKNHQYEQAVLLFRKSIQKENSKDILKTKWEDILQVHGEIQSWSVRAIGTNGTPVTNIGFSYMLYGTRGSGNGDAIIDLEPKNFEGTEWEIVKIQLN